MSQLVGSWSACSRRSEVTSWVRTSAIGPSSMLMPTTARTKRGIALLAIAISLWTRVRVRSLLPHRPSRRCVNQYVVKNSLDKGHRSERCQAIRSLIPDPQPLARAARWGGIRQCVRGEDLEISVALEDEPMVVAVPLHPECHLLPALDRPQASGVEPRAVLTGGVCHRGAVADQRDSREDIGREAHVRIPYQTNGRPHIMHVAAGCRSGGIEERAAEEGDGLAPQGIAGTAIDPYVIDLDRGLDRGDGSGVGERQEEAAGVLAMVRVRLAIDAVEQAQPVVLELHRGLSASPFFFADPLILGELPGVEIVIQHQGLHSIRERACQNDQNYNPSGHSINIQRLSLRRGRRHCAPTTERCVVKVHAHRQCMLACKRYCATALSAVHALGEPHFLLSFADTLRYKGDTKVS